MVHNKRSIICPNVGFFRQLIELEVQKHGVQTINIIEPSPGIFVADVVWQVCVHFGCDFLHRIVRYEANESLYISSLLYKHSQEVFEDVYGAEAASQHFGDEHKTMNSIAADKSARDA